MQKRTICCKLAAIPAIDAALSETSRVFADACNYILTVAIEQKTSNAIQLHHLCYSKIRKMFGLSANLAVRSIRRVSATLKHLKGARKAPRLFEAKSIDYDARIFSCQMEKETVSLMTVKGRMKAPMILGAYQRKMLAGQNPKAATVINKKGVWYIHLVIERKAISCTSNRAMGIDLGITNIAMTSTAFQIEGKPRQQFKADRQKVRASLQSKQTKGAKKILKKISGKEKRRIYENHVLSKQLVEEAIRHDCGIIRMEQLKDIRRRTKTWNKHLNHMMAGWSFYQLQQFVIYKASAVGISVELVDPKYTSQTCHRCLNLGSRQGERFNCTTCGETHADFNAACVISLGGAACKPARISSPAS
jgi:IS605 OrfB family transposase